MARDLPESVEEILAAQDARLAQLAADLAAADAAAAETPVELAAEDSDPPSLTTTDWDRDGWAIAADATYAVTLGDRTNGAAEADEGRTAVLASAAGLTTGVAADMTATAQVIAYAPVQASFGSMGLTSFDFGPAAEAPAVTVDASFTTVSGCACAACSNVASDQREKNATCAASGCPPWRARNMSHAALVPARRAASKAVTTPASPPAAAAITAGLSGIRRRSSRRRASGACAVSGLRARNMISPALVPAATAWSKASRSDISGVTSWGGMISGSSPEVWGIMRISSALGNSAIGTRQADRASKGRASKGRIRNRSMASLADIRIGASSLACAIRPCPSALSSSRPVRQGLAVSGRQDLSTMLHDQPGSRLPRSWDPRADLPVFPFHPSSYKANSYGT